MEQGNDRSKGRSMRKLAADHKLMACLVAILVVTALLGGISYSVLSQVNRTFEIAVNSTARKLWLAGDINMAAGDMLAAQRGILLYADTPAVHSNMRLFEVRSAQVDRDAAELRSLSVNQEELKIIGIVEASNASYRDVVEPILQLPEFDSADTTEVANAYKSIDEITDQLEVLESKYLRDALAQTRTRLKYGRIALGVCAAIALCIVIFALQTVFSIGAALRRSAEEARSSAEKLRTSNALVRSISDSLPCAVCIFGVEGDLKRWNNNFLGYSFEEMLKTGVLATVEPDGLEAVKQALVKTFETGYSEVEAYLRNKDGNRVPAYLSHRRFVYEGELCILGVAVDISKQKKAEQYSQLQRVALESASEGIVITDAAGIIEWANPAFSTLTGYSLEEVLGVNPRIFKSGMMDLAFYRTLWRTILNGETWSGELWNLNKEGDLYSEEMHIAPVRSSDGRISNFVAVKHDITERKQAEAKAERAKQGLVSLNKELREANENILKLSQTDALTGLANRRTMDERMNRELARAERLGCGFSVILGDLDHFKSINDEFGHLVGDRVLVAAAAVLGKQARPYDLPARFGGEEFMILLPESTLADAMTIAQRIRSAIYGAIVPGMERRITMSLGISTWGHGDTSGELIGRADIALYQAKRRGRNRVVAQTCDMPSSIAEQVLAGEAQGIMMHRM
jgi:diguanylate cyclase (GGDEF)-like protein/PAS domain S-box-containing protein